MATQRSSGWPPATPHKGAPDNFALLLQLLDQDLYVTGQILAEANCKTNPQLYLIQDPASKLSPKEEVSVVRCMVGQNDWKEAAEPIA